MLRGRPIEHADRADAPRDAVVNEAFVQRFWPGQNALGKRLGNGDELDIEVVGITPNGKYRLLNDRDLPYLYLSAQQFPEAEMTVHMRTTSAPAALAAL